MGIFTKCSVLLSSFSIHYKDNDWIEYYVIILSPSRKGKEKPLTTLMEWKRTEYEVELLLFHTRMILIHLWFNCFNFHKIVKHFYDTFNLTFVVVILSQFAYDRTWYKQPHVEQNPYTLTQYIQNSHPFNRFHVMWWMDCWLVGYGI